jgi:hypothetical protein
MKKSKNRAENHQFFAGSFMKTITSGKNRNSQFFDSDFLKGKKEPEVLCFVQYLMNRRFFEKLKSCTTPLQGTITSILHFGVFYTCMAYMAHSCHRSRALWPPLPSERELVVCGTVAGSRRTIAALVWFGLVWV